LYLKNGDNWAVVLFCRMSSDASADGRVGAMRWLVLVEDYLS
jgi:hypothetical protein